MNLTITPLNQYKPNFKANPLTVLDSGEQLIQQATTRDSSLFAPFEKKYDKFTNWLAKNVTSKYAESKPIEYLANKFKDSKNLFQHTLTVGSVITSGLYMQRTYTNKDLDKDRRNTLVVNQGLTLALSTAGAYMLDKFLNGWWENVTAKFAGHLLEDDKFYNDFLKKKNAIIKENKQLKEALKKGEKVELKSIPKIIDLIKENPKFLQIGKQEAKDLLLTKVKGMSPLKSMIVFGFVYRYFVPVVVTKPANKLCDMYLEHKKAKEKAEQK